MARGPALAAEKSVLGILLISAAALALFLFLTRSLQLIDRDEGRYAEIAREMLESGDWLVPRLFGVPYLEKPPLYYWLTAIAYRLVGVNELGARLVSALAAAGGVLATGLFARRFFGARAGLLASVILATSGLYFVLARVAITDMLFAVAISGALMAYFVAEVEGRSYLPFWLLAAAAMLVKGPVASVIAALVALGHLAVNASWRRLLAARFWIGLALFLALTLPWFSLVEIRLPGFLDFYVYKEHLLRAAGGEHRQGLWWYVPWLLLGFLPWTPILVAALGPIGRRLREPSLSGMAARFTAIWAAVVLVFFSLPRGKLVPYILPMFPALAILLADALDRSLEDPAERWLPRSFRVVAAAFAVGLIALPVAAAISPIEIPPSLVALAVALVAVAAAAVWSSAGRRDIRPIAAIAGAVALAQCVAVLVAAPILRRLTVQPIVEILRERLGPDDGVAIHGGYFPSLPFYLGRMPYFVFGNRELDFGVSLEGPGPWIVADMRALRERVGARRLFVVLRTRERDLHDLLRLPAKTRLLHRGRSSSLVENEPPKGSG
ncbi:MAG: glycosyltransferase family 39 protein [Candidatus Binatia bacterium]